MSVSFIITFLLLAALVAAAVTDLWGRIIPNIIPLMVVGLFIAAMIFWPEFRDDWLLRLAAFAIAFIIGFIFFAAGVMGGGDVKLFAALALFYTPGGLPLLALAISIAGAGVALFFAMIDFISLRRKGGGPLVQDLRQALKTRVPYGVAILLGQVWVMYLTGGM